MILGGCGQWGTLAKSAAEADRLLTDSIQKAVEWDRDHEWHSILISTRHSGIAEELQGFQGHFVYWRTEGDDISHLKDLASTIHMSCQ